MNLCLLINVAPQNAAKSPVSRLLVDRLRRPENTKIKLIGLNSLKKIIWIIWKNLCCAFMKTFSLASEKRSFSNLKKSSVPLIAEHDESSRWESWRCVFLN